MANSQNLAGSYGLVAAGYGQILLVVLNVLHPNSFASAMIINLVGAGILYLAWFAFEKLVPPKNTEKD